MNTGSQLLLAAFFAVSVAACDRPADNRTEGATGTSGEASALDMGERNFVQEQIKDGLAEVKLGELAEKQASSPDVKQFASTMVQDHTRAGNQLKEIAQRENVELEAEDRTEAGRDEYERLAKLSGVEFDRKYIDRMVKDHQDAVDALQDQAENADHASVKQWASATLPRIKHHLEEAQQLQQKLNNENRQERGTAGSRTPR